MRLGIIILTTIFSFGLSSRAECQNSFESKDRSDDYTYKKGFFIDGRVGASFGLQKWNKTIMIVPVLEGGYRILPFYHLGAGITYFSQWNNLTTTPDVTGAFLNPDYHTYYLPVYLVNRFFLFNKRCSPFLVLNLGYTFNLTEKGEPLGQYTVFKGDLYTYKYFTEKSFGGYYISLGAGVRIFLTRNLLFLSSCEFTIYNPVTVIQEDYYQYWTFLKSKSYNGGEDPHLNIMVNIGIGF